MFDRAVRPSDFSYKHKAERTVNFVLTPISDCMDEEIYDGLKAALDASPNGAIFAPLLIVCESDAGIRKTTDNVVASDVPVSPQHRAIEEDAAADIGVADDGS